MGEIKEIRLKEKGERKGKRKIELGHKSDIQIWFTLQLVL